MDTAKLQTIQKKAEIYLEKVEKLQETEFKARCWATDKEANAALFLAADFKVILKPAAEIAPAGTLTEEQVFKDRVTYWENAEPKARELIAKYLPDELADLDA